MKRRTTSRAAAALRRSGAAAAPALPAIASNTMAPELQTDVVSGVALCAMVRTSRAWERSGARVSVRVGEGERAGAGGLQMPDAARGDRTAAASMVPAPLSLPRRTDMAKLTPPNSRAYLLPNLSRSKVQNGEIDNVRNQIRLGLNPDTSHSQWSHFLEVDGKMCQSEGTALHEAAAWGQLEIANILLDAGADPNAFKEGGYRPLHYAAYNEHVDVVRLLLEYVRRWGWRRCDSPEHGTSSALVNMCANARVRCPQCG